MLGRLDALVEHDASIVKKLQVVGIFNAGASLDGIPTRVRAGLLLTHPGLSFQLVRMSSPLGYVSVLQREKRQEVPKTVGDFGKLLHLLKCVAQMKVRDVLMIDVRSVLTAV